MTYKILALAALVIQSVVAQARFRSIFDSYPDGFCAELLLEVFREENGQEEFLLNETNSLIEELVTEFSDLLQVETIGYTREWRPLQVVSFKNIDPDGPAVLIDGLHHAREIATVKMAFAILLQQLYKIHHGDEKAINLSRTVQLYVWPVVNPDGLAYIESKENFGNYGENIVLKRKNTRFTAAHCTEQLQGVDLNRNYDISVQPSSPWDADQDPCWLTYRGDYPFSEPETRAMRDFVLDHQDTIKFAISYHSFGNMLVIPYSGADRTKRLTEDQRAIYGEIYDDCNYADQNTIMGTGPEMVRYVSNGEASDWILYNTGIIAMSPELGSSDIQSMNFDIWSVELEAEVVMENLVMPAYLLEKSLPQIRITPQSTTVQIMGSQILFFVDVSNTGLSDILVPFNLTFNLTVETTTHSLWLEVPALAAREKRTYRLAFQDVTRQQLVAIKSIERITSQLTRGRAGLYLDISLEDDSLAEQIGWVESNERLLFLNSQDSLVLKAQGGIAEEYGLTPTTGMIAALAAAVIIFVAHVIYRSF